MTSGPSDAAEHSRFGTRWESMSNGLYAALVVTAARIDRRLVLELLAIGRSWINATLGNRRRSDEGGPAKWNDLGRISLGVPFRATSKHSLSNIAMLVVIGAGFSCGRDILRSCCFEDLLGF